MIKLRIFLMIMMINIANATVEIDILTGKIETQPALRSELYCSECAHINIQRQSECPVAVSYVVSQTLERTLYNYMIGKKLLDSCHSGILKDVSSSTILDKNVSAMLGHEFNLSQNGIVSCFNKNHIDFKTVKNGIIGSQKVITSYFHVLHRNLLDIQNENLEQIASIDQLLGNAPLNNFKCDVHFESKCKDLRTCRNPDAFKEVTDFSMDVLEKITELTDQKTELANLVKTRAINNKAYQLSIKEINENIVTLQSMVPWFKGDFLESVYNRNYNLTKGDKKISVRKEFEFALKKQLVKTKNTIEQNYFNANITLNCLKNNQGCSEKILENMNDFVKRDYSKNKIDNEKYNSQDSKSRESYVEALETNLFLASGKCVSDLLHGKKEIDESASIVAATGLGFLSGGSGGFIRLGQLALKVTQAGNRVKALGSMALLSAEAKITLDSFRETANECSKAVNNLQDEQSSFKACSTSGVNVFKLTSLRPCLVNIALTTAPVIIGLKQNKILKMNAEELDLEKALKEAHGFYLSKITNPLITPSEKDKLAEVLSKLKLTTSEANDVLSKINTTLNTEKDKNRLNNYINFVMSLRADDQKLAIQRLHEAVSFSGNFNPGGYVEKFFVKENKFYLFEKMKTKSIQEKLIKQGKSENVALKEAEEIARKSRADLQRKYYSCQSKTLTPELKTAAARYAGFSMALGIGGATYGFTKNNQELFEDNKPEFFGKLSYDIAMAYFLSKLSAEVMKSPEGNFLQRYNKTNVGTAKLGIIDSVIYSSIFGVSEEEARKKVEEIMHTQDLKKELKILDEYINKENLISKYKQNIIDGYNKILSNPNKNEILGSPPYSVGDEKFSSLIPEDLNKPEVKEKLIKAVINKMNSGDSAFLSTGEKGADRWINDRVWNATIGIPKGIVVGMGLFQVLCLGIDNPIASLGLATGIQFTNQFLSGDGYYKFRKEFIGQ